MGQIVRVPNDDWPKSRYNCSVWCFRLDFFFVDGKSECGLIGVIGEGGVLVSFFI